MRVSGRESERERRVKGMEGEHVERVNGGQEQEYAVGSVGGKERTRTVARRSTKRCTYSTCDKLAKQMCP